MATIGAAGFLTSAVLPATYYHVRNPHLSIGYKLTCLVSLWLSHRGCIWCILLVRFYQLKNKLPLTLFSIPPLLGWLSCNLHSTGAVGLAIAINVSVGAPGQIAGVWIYKADESKKGYPTGHWTNAALLLCVAVGCVGLRIYYGWVNKGILKNGGLERKSVYRY